MNLTERARAFDRDDPLAGYRAKFQLPQGICYLDGNSLGAMPKVVPDVLADVAARQWGEDLIAGWNEHDWLTLPLRVGDQIGALVGAAPGQVLCADNLSSNLFKLLYTAVTMRPQRHVILTDRDNFPTDNYIAEGLAAMLGEARCVVRYTDPDHIKDAALDDVAVVSLTHVDFRTGVMRDMAQITEQVQAAGALMLWDLAHSAGVVDIQLDALGVDMAVGCTYKYLNGGPGSPGFLYLRSQHQAAAAVAIQGWMGHRALFAFDAGYAPAPGISRFMTGTQGVLGLQTLGAALSVFEGVTPAMIRAKSVALTDFFLAALAASPEASLLPCITPSDPALRGSQVCLRHANGYAVAQALIAAGVVVDFREPDIIRFGFSPLYVSYAEVFGAVEILEDILRTGVWREPQFATRKAVT